MTETTAIYATLGPAGQRQKGECQKGEGQKGEGQKEEPQKVEGQKEEPQEAEGRRSDWRRVCQRSGQSSGQRTTTQAGLPTV